MRAKAKYYNAHEALPVWLVFPLKRAIEVYTADGDLVILNESDTLSGGDVLLGFTMAVKDVFEV